MLQETRLTNGLKVMLIEQHELPLVQLDLLVDGGWSADPQRKPGVARLTSDLQDEGTRTLSALEISDQLKEIGADLGTSSDFDSSTVSLSTLKKHLDKALALFSDVLINPVFPEEELQRKKGEYLARILMEQKQPRTVALKNFFETLYGPDHPYGQPYTGSGTEDSIAAIQRDDLVAYYNTYFSPGNATLIAVGDTSLSELTPLLEEAMGEWRDKSVPTLELPPIRPVPETQVYLIDKPGAAQSVIVAGHLGIPRSSKDYFSVEVLNTILGGKFTSRLNMNLREDKAYTYGAFSQFVFRKALGPFFAFTQVHTEVTRESLSEIMKEFRGLLGENPVTTEELDSTRNYIALRFPGEFETVSQLAAKLSELAEFNLPRDYYDSYVPNLEKVSVSAVTEAARAHLHPDRMLITIVGDVAKIEAGIRELNLGPIHLMDAQGNPVEK
jgi:zinc protease